MDDKQYWSIKKEDGRAILVRDCIADPVDHSDFIEMSGLYASIIVNYGTVAGKAEFTRKTIFPMLRVFPNLTNCSYRLLVDNESIPKIYVNGCQLTETVENFILNGTVECNSVYKDETASLKIRHVFFPTTDAQAVCETYTVTNCGEGTVELSIPDGPVKKINAVVGPMGAIGEYIHAFIVSDEIEKQTKAVLKPGEQAVVALVYSACYAMSPDPADDVDVLEAYEKRIERVKQLISPLKLDTGNEIFDTMFELSKVRAGESIFRTKKGDIHCPGGWSYYAAVWCNDQVEYAGPWQAYTGDAIQVNAGYNGYAWYYPFMADTYDNPIPSSIISEATNYWNGAGDRGDAAMYLYGASRYALTCGNLGRDNALWKAILWCAGFCLSRKNEEGVITSDSDELEHRLPSGKANLCTNMLTLGGLRFASRIASALGDVEHKEQFENEAEMLEKACEGYFAGVVHGFDTYKYYEDNTTLRSWICMPLCMDVFTHAEGTTAAITSEHLMSDAGQLSEEGGKIAWDRSTLYGLRGMFRAGKCKEAYDYLNFYCRNRLIGRHVPYAVEAWPEGGMRHLSAESALFCQIVTEGILAITPLSFSSFSFIPQLPEGMDHLQLSDIHAFGETFEIKVRKDGWSVSTGSGKTFSGNSQTRQTIVF